ncbi:MAG: bifunctional diaminohydroxyphosphoribosylaminopyrimidine deaminase/5-amino-6-(5-phosphoribosylamino)uracil reductase RibD [Clostridia bacterium]|nr:bifunctional diaminohydroxyphosphoribosylaminopyrimidine deaminase/5-amino-6-(5-phosphoribosylamino)uracil reductase RibD [Clostridia bacterium]
MSLYEKHMRRAIELAKLGWGRTNPNPLVGAVIAKGEQTLSEGYHEALGRPHAEVAAISKAGCSLEGSTMYVNLEPCCHYGRTPPCTKAIIEAGIKQVVIAMRDPNPKVSGRGVQILKDAGIMVVEGVLEYEAKMLNEIFVKYIKTQKPFVIMKAAMTLDGKIATFCGDSKWVSGEGSRKHVHETRDRVAAVMIGINTVLADNPLLTTRLDGKNGKDCTKIIVDSCGRIPLDCNIFSGRSLAGIILATTSRISAEKESMLIQRGVRIIKLEDSKGRVDLVGLMDELGRLGLDSVLLEGGGELNASALETAIVDKIMFFIAPKIIGGKNAKTPVEGEGIKNMDDALRLKEISVKMLGNDMLYEAYVDYIKAGEDDVYRNN